MNDLSGLNWTSSGPSTNATNSLSSSTNDRFASLKPSSASISRQPSPLSSGRNTPASQPSSTPKAGADSFANLLSSSSNTRKTSNLSLQERQRQLSEEKARQVQAQAQQHADQYRTHDASFWEDFGSGRSTPANGARRIPTGAGHVANDEDDILAAFNASAPVDASSHFPPPSLSNGTSSNQASRTQSRTGMQAVPIHSIASQSTTQQSLFEDDDDPFGLNELKPRPSASRATPAPLTDDDDILGELGKPLVQKPVFVQPELDLDKSDEEPTTTSEAHPQDQAIAELVDMGFDPQKARRALEQTGDGMDVQEAVGLLLVQAHEESRNKSRVRGGDETLPAGSGSRRSGSQHDGRSADLSASRPRHAARPDRTDSRSPGSADKDVTQYASEIGGQLFKSANSLWRTGQKRVQKAMADLNQDGDGSQPKWMREAQLREREEKGQTRPEHDGKSRKVSDVTDEAMMLEPGRAPPRPESRNIREGGRPVTQVQRTPAFQDGREPISRTASSHREKLSRQAIEEQSAQAYVSPARRKRTTPAPELEPQPARDSNRPPPASSDTTQSMDIFSDMQPQPPRQPVPSQNISKSAPGTNNPITSTRSQPKAIKRAIPATSPNAIAQSNHHRAQGTAAFKRGDYAAATTSYTASLSTLPPSHPIVIVLQANLALTHLKTGDAKSAISCSDAALNLIGPNQGSDESIAITNEEGVPEEKSMREFYGKVLSRRAEALEHLEKWPDAAQAWREAVEAGFGGATAIRARQRCEKAAIGGDARAAGRPPSKAVSQKPIPVRKPPSASNDLRAASAPPSEAVTRLRAANAAAVAASDEAFALNDSVSARISGWKNGKEGNLRALLASLDSVLWAGANWTKVGMGDLVLPNRCKIVYMKAIGRVHPDKIAQDATTEQKMVSSSVFSTLNEAWDKFKRENGL